MNKKLTLSNVITITRFLLLPVIVYFLVKEMRPVAFAIMLVALASDVLDGFIARKLHQETELGKILDPVCDKVSLAVILITLLLLNSIPPWAVAIIAVRDLMILFGSFIVFRRSDIVFKSNLLGKITGLLFGGMILAFTLGWRQIGMILFYASVPAMFGSFITYIQRYIAVMSEKKGMS